MTRRTSLMAMFFLAACEEPKAPAPCTGTEQWPDPCAASKAPPKDAGPLLPDKR